MVNNHDDRFRPQDLGLFNNPFQMAFYFMADINKWGVIQSPLTSSGGPFLSVQVTEAHESPRAASSEMGPMTDLCDKRYIYLHGWLILWGFHVGKYTMDPKDGCKIAFGEFCKKNT